MGLMGRSKGSKSNRMWRKRAPIGDPIDRGSGIE